MKARFFPSRKELRRGKEAASNVITEESKIQKSSQRQNEGQGHPRQYADLRAIMVSVATEPAWITSNQIEAARVALTRSIKRGGQVWIKIFPDKPVTEKPAETRMGSGKGSPEYWVAVVKPGRVMFEMGGVTEDEAKEALRLAMHKLPVKCKFVKRETPEEVGVEA